MTTRTDVLRIRIETDNEGNARASLAGVADSADKVAQSTSGATTATTANTEAMSASAQTAAALAEVEAARAEVEQAAIARLHDMAKATLTANDANMAQLQDDARELVLKQAQAEMQARYTELLLASTKVQMGMTLTSKEQASAQAAVNGLYQTGAITADEERVALEALAKAKILDVGATKEQISSRTAYSIDALVSDAATGQFSRSRRELAAVATESGLLQKLMSPLGFAIGGTVVALGLFGKAVYDREQDLLAFNKALAATGDYAGTTGLALQGTASLVGTATGRYNDATKAVLALAQSGEVVGTRMQDMATIAVNMAYMTGESIEKVTKDLISLQGDPTAAIAKTTTAMGLLTSAQYNQIVMTQQQQGVQAAAALAMKDLEAASDSARQKLVENAGIVTRTWEGVKSTFSDLGRIIARIGATESTAEQLADIQRHIDNQATAAERAALQKYYQPQIDQLKKQMSGDAMFAAGQELANQGKQAHDKALADALAYTKQGSEGFVAAADALNRKRYAALVGIVDPAIRDRINASYDQQIRDAAKRANSEFQGGSSGGRAPHDTGPGALASFSQYVGNLAAQSQGNQMDDSAIGKYITGVEKLDDAFDKAIAKHADLTAATAKYNEGIQALGANLAKTQAQQAAADTAFKTQLDDQLSLRQRAIDLQVQSLGMGAKETQRMQELNQISQQFDQQLAQLNRERDRGSISLQQYNDRLDALKANEQATINATVAGYARMDAAMGDWRNGAIRALEDMRDQFSDVAGQMDQTFTNAFSNMNQAIVNWEQTGKFSGKQFADNLIADLVQIESHVLESQILQSILGAFMPSGTGIASSYMSGGGSSYAASGVNWNVGLLGSAQGNVFASPSLSQYSNQIVSQPTLFAFAQGAGIMGEGGRPEAIIPLTRTASGDLGVKAQGGGGNVQVIVENHSDSQAQVQQSKDSNGGDIIKVIVGQAVSEVNNQIGRGGSTYKVLQQMFGLNRRGVPVAGG